MRRFCLLALCALMSACVPVEPDPQFDPRFGQAPLRYAASFPGWVVEVREDGVVLRQGPDVAFYGRAPTTIYGQAGNRYEGSARRTFIVEGRAQTEDITFRLDVEFSPCPPASGSPDTSVAYLLLDRQTTPTHGCGGAPERHPISRLP